MAITYEINEKDGIISFHFSSPPTIDDYQQAFPAAIEQVVSGNINRWLLIFDEYSLSDTDDKSEAFGEFVAREINRYISKIAIVCPAQYDPRFQDVLEPIRNQDKPIGMFQTIEEAQDWLRL